MSLCACNALQLWIARDFQSLEAVEETNFPILHWLRNKFFHKAEQPDYLMPESRSQFLQSLHQLDAFPNTPFGKPSLELKLLGHDVFYSMQMLASLEMPTMVCDQLSVLQASTHRVVMRHKCGIRNKQLEW